MTAETDSSPDLDLPPRRRRRTVWIALLLVAAAGGYVLWRRLSPERQEPVSYRTEALARGDIERQVTATGTLSPLVTVTVGSQVTGRLREISVDYNSPVRKGQVIARIDPQLFQTEVERARANLAAARANVEKAEADAREAKLQYERDRDLAKQKVVATAEVQTRFATLQSTRAQVAAARAAVEQAKAALSQARANLAYTTIVSPIDGVVVSRSVDVGQTVAASLQAPTLFTIAEDLRRMEVHTSVAESDIGLVTEGMPVHFTVDAFPNETFAGEVKQLRYEAQTVQNVVTYDAVVRVDNEQLKLRPGMTANVTFVVARRRGVLKVPNAALRFRPTLVPAARRPGARADRAKPGPTGARAKLARRGPPTGAGAKQSQSGPPTGRPGRGHLVWILRHGQPEPIRVSVGITDGSYTEVVAGGLHEADRVIVGIEGQDQRRKPWGRKGPPRIL